MDQIVWFVIGFITALIVVRAWILWALHDASEAYRRALKINNETRKMLGEDLDP